MRPGASPLDIPGSNMWYDAQDARVDDEWTIVYWPNRVTVAGTIATAVFGPLLGWLS